MTEQEEFEFRLRLEQEQGSKPAQAEPPQAVSKPILGGGEALLSLGTGMAAGPVSGFMGLAGAALPGPQGQGQQWQEQTAQNMTYQPRSWQGQAGAEIASYPFVKLAELGRYAGENVQEGYQDPEGHPYAFRLNELTGGRLGNVAATIAETGINFLPNLFLGPLKGKAPAKPVPTQRPAGRVEPSIGGTNVFRYRRDPIGEQVGPSLIPDETIPLGSIRNPQNRIKYETWKEANREGYVFPPTQIEDSFLRGRMEGIGGKAATKQEATIRNQQTTNDLARRAAGLQKGVPIDEGVLAQARETAAAPYREIAAMSPQAAKALQKLKEVRSEAKMYHRHADIAGDPKSIKKAKQLDDMGETYERAIEREAAMVGQPQLIDRLRAARRKIAINWDIDRALNVGTGDVDAKAIARMLDKRGVGGMSGELLTIGKTAKAFPQFMGSGPSVPTPGVSALEAPLAAGMGMAGAASGLGWWPAGMAVAGGPMRGLLLSKKMQTPLRAGTAGLSLRDIARGSELPLAITPSLGLRPPEE